MPAAYDELGDRLVEQMDGSSAETALTAARTNGRQSEGQMGKLSSGSIASGFLVTVPTRSAANDQHPDRDNQ